jgi:HCOMODA/2-hydroxy-3-carboxy-muconic semialdehyde decarboxylase
VSWSVPSVASLSASRKDLVSAGRTLSRLGLVTTFGHVSVRVDHESFVITPPSPLGRVKDPEACLAVRLDVEELPLGVPLEAWIHLSIYRRRPDVGAVCRAQPLTATAMASAGVPIVPLHGQGAFLGPSVAVFDDAVLLRDATRADAMAAELGAGYAIILKGNGAVAVGDTVAEAVARMVVLEASAQINAHAAAAGRPRALTESEQDAWRAVAPEILERIWSDLTASD